MKDIVIPFSACGDMMICIGKQGENKASRVLIDCTDQTVTGGAIKVKNAGGVVYPAVAVMQDGVLIWEITNSDTACSGLGEAQVELYGANNQIIKTAIIQVGVLPSLIATDDTPNAVQDWIDSASSILQKVETSTESFSGLLPVTSADNGKIARVVDGAWAKVAAPSGSGGTGGADGESAYEIAVRNGFVGSESVWLESLKGAPGQGVPAGGATGQVLSKQSATDYDTAWVDPPAGGSGSADGKDGKDGESAYEIAVRNGFTGTESEWLESLKGADGQDGAKGDAALFAMEVREDGHLYVVYDDGTPVPPLSVVDGHLIYTVDSETDQTVDLGNVTPPAYTPLDAYPVGSIYMSVSNTSPEVLFGGTWEQIYNRFLFASGDHPVGGTGGEATHTLTIDEMPQHTHTVNWDKEGGTGTGNGILARNSLDGNWPYGYQTGATGGSAAHNNMPPFLSVNMWKRTA